MKNGQTAFSNQWAPKPIAESGNAEKTVEFLILAIKGEMRITQERLGNVKQMYLNCEFDIGHDLPDNLSVPLFRHFRNDYKDFIPHFVVRKGENDFEVGHLPA